MKWHTVVFPGVKIKREENKKENAIFFPFNNDIQLHRIASFLLLVLLGRVWNDGRSSGITTIRWRERQKKNTNESNPQMSIRNTRAWVMIICRHVVVSTFRKDVVSVSLVASKKNRGTQVDPVTWEAWIKATQETVWRKNKMDLQPAGCSWGNGQNQSPLATETKRRRLLHVFLCNGNCRQPDLSVVHTTADPHGIGIDPEYVVCNWKRS